MQPNRRRGEISAELDGRTRILCLTLGALAELESAFGAEDLGALVARFTQGRLSAQDIIRIVAAGLRGAGEAVTDDEVARMRCADGIAGFATVVGELLSQTFGGGPAEEGAATPNP